MSDNNQPDPDEQELRDSYDKLKQKNPPMAGDIFALLGDPQFQKGLAWRQGVMRGVREAFAQGKKVDWIKWFLTSRGGLTEPTARRIINDAFMEEPKEPNGGESVSPRNRKKRGV